MLVNGDYYKERHQDKIPIQSHFMVFLLQVKIAFSKITKIGKSAAALT